MRNLKFILAILIVGSLISSCATSVQTNGTSYNPQTQEVERYKYTEFYQLETEIVPEKLELTLVTQLHKRKERWVYKIQEFTRRLLPNDNLATSNTTLYLQNLSNQNIKFDLISVSIENQHLPLSERSLNIPANKAISIPLGEIKIDLRLITLNTRIEYIAESTSIIKEHKEKEFDLLRNKKKIEEESQTDEEPETNKKTK
ncbi:MAG: hypothetical protein OQL19_09280 [Gammaproteobacteria bacterium]|nr:hypothetical protein [Gammaproteobacteria bacterium]